MTQCRNTKREFRGIGTDVLRGLEAHRISSDRIETAAARLAEKAFLPLIKELFDALPLQCIRAEIVSAPSDDDSYDVSGVKFFADPLTNEGFARFAAKSPYWKDYPVKRDERFKRRSCVSDYQGDCGGALVDAFALDGSGVDEVEEAMAEAYRKLKQKVWPEADRCLKELDRYAFTAERTPSGSVSFRVFGFNPNALSGVAEMRRKRRTSLCR